MTNKAKKILDRFWFLLWKDDSWKGWILSIVVLFIFIKWIFFPLLSLATGTILPLAIVESCSMYHDNSITHDYETWWDYKQTSYNKFEITKEDFSSFIFKNGFNKGDVLFIINADQDKLKVGDIIIFQAPTTNPVIHRIIKIQEKDGKKIFSTMGDNNNGQIAFEKEITEDQLIGKAVLKVAPYAGWLKLIFYESSKPAYEKGLCKLN
jgi:signal peptidase I